MNLDNSQRAILALADGVSAAVIGAPGTGKTATLVELVADRVLARGYSSSEVLVLVPTRTGATALRERLALRLRVSTNGPLARTANSLAFQIVEAAAARAGDRAPVLLTGGEQDQIVARLLQGDVEAATGPVWPEPLVDEVRLLGGFRTELRDLMMRAVEYGVNADALARLGEQLGRPEWVAAAAFIGGYEDVKDELRPGQYDSTELSQFAAAVVEGAAAGPAGAPGPAGAATLGALAGLRLIVLEDAQEITQATLTLVAQFAARGVAVVAFGDPDISTGSSRGAHPELLARLGSYLGTDAQVLILSSVHRHGAAVRAVVQEITSRIGTAAAGTHRAAGTCGTDCGTCGTQCGTNSAVSGTKQAVTGTVQALIVSSPGEQAATIAHRLRERHVFDQVPWASMAVVVRTGTLVGSLATELARLEVPTRVSVAQTVLRDEVAVKAFILALEVTLGRREMDAEIAAELLRGPLGGLSSVRMRRLRVALRFEELTAGGARSADEILAEVLRDPAALGGIDTAQARKAAALAGNLFAARADAAAGGTIEDLLWGLWERSGLAARWLTASTGVGPAATEANHNLDAMVALFFAATRFVERNPGAAAVLFLEHLVDAEIAEDTLAARNVANTVLVSTPSGVIGEEFEVVVLAGVQENVWPDMRLRGSMLGAGDLAAVASGREMDGAERTVVLHDELRLFAQAASRARHELVVVAVSDEGNRPSPFLRLLPAAQLVEPDEFPLSLPGMVGPLRRALTIALGGGDLVRAGQAAATLGRLSREGIPGADPAQWYGAQEPSTTRPLNDENDHPVRVSPSKMSAFETCPLHWLIGQLVGSSSTSSNLGTIIHKVMETATDISADALWAGVEAQWGRLRFDAEWESRMRKGEARQLTDRLAAYLGDTRRAGTTLLAAEGQFTLDVAGAVLSGTIDRVERLADGRAIIVDLKTGKTDPVTDQGVNDHPQLGAYQLAFHDGIIDGVEPGMQLAGARLVIVSSGTVKQNYRNPTQQPFTPEQLDAFRTRVGFDAAGMGAGTFLAEISDHCLDPWAFGACRIHVIGQVCS